MTAYASGKTDRRGAPASKSSFVLTTTDPSYRTPGFIGNGSFSILSTPLGISPAVSFAAGVYDRAPGDVPRIAALPAWNVFDVSVGGGWLNDAVHHGGLQSYRQTLDMYKGLLQTTYDWTDVGKRISVDVVAFVSRVDPGLAVIRLRIVPRESGRLTLRFPLRDWPAPVRLPLAELERLPVGKPRRNIWYPGHLVVTHRNHDSLGLQVDGGSTRIAVAQSVGDPRGVKNLERSAAELSFDAIGGKPVVLTKFVGVATSRDGSTPLAPALATVRRAGASGYRALRAEHANAWQRLWATDIVVEGDPKLQRLIHAMQFYLLSSVREESAGSVPPMGLSSAGFYGHIFWDADTWMFPPLVLMHPGMARTIVAFRWETLAAAQRSAVALGYRGAKFPWEADERGEEATPRFAAQNARGEVHITGDVALAQWQFYLATGDLEWLSREGYPVIKETADFWVSRVTYDAAKDRYHICDVVSVDEGLVGVDDDAYTNVVARRNLEIAAAACRAVGMDPDPEWTRIAARIHVPYDAAGDRHDTYEGASPGTRSSAVPLLAYPLMLPMTDGVKRNDLAHTIAQLGIRNKGAMMSGVLYPVVGAELGDQALVDRLFPGSYQGNLRPPFDVLAERPINEAVNFLTGAGAFLQQLIFGYGGLRLHESGLRSAFTPLLPSGIRRMTLRNFSVRGIRQDIMVERQGVRFVPKRLTSSAARPRPAELQELTS